MTAPVDFGRFELANAVAVGAVTAAGARLWVRSERPGALAVTLRADDGSSAVVVHGRVESAPDGSDGTLAFDVPGGLAGGGPAGSLRPLTRYRVEIARADDGARLGEARFETAPAGRGDAPGHFCFAALSCHQPFDDDGRLVPESLRMLRATRRALRERDVKFALLMGDQIYSDTPARFSLFDEDHFRTVAPPGRRTILECTAAEVRALYQYKHRAFWGVEEAWQLLAEFPCYPMLDDHEVVDNFGSDPRHAGPDWRALREGALDAFYDYQASRVLGAPPRGADADAHYSFAYGACSVFVMDLRSARRTTERDAQIYSPAQFASLERFLAVNAAQKVIALVVTVPIIYLESWAVNVATALTGEGSDVADRWNYAKSVDQRDLLMALLRAHHARHPRQRLIVLGGDIHVGCAFRLDWDTGGPPLWQFTSSAVSNRQSPLAARLAELVPGATSRVELQGGVGGNVALLKGVEGASHNPYGGLNAGVVHIRDRGEAGAEIEFELLGVADDAEEARTVFRSGPL